MKGILSEKIEKLGRDGATQIRIGMGKRISREKGDATELENPVVRTI
jgi:hypothetical protein